MREQASTVLNFSLAHKYVFSTPSLTTSAFVCLFCDNVTILRLFIHYVYTVIVTLLISSNLAKLD